MHTFKRGGKSALPTLNTLVNAYSNQLISSLWIVCLVCKSLSISSLNKECTNIALFQSLFELNRISMPAQMIDSYCDWWAFSVCKVHLLVHRVFGSYLSRACVQIQPFPPYIHTYINMDTLCIVQFKDTSKEINFKGMKMKEKTTKTYYTTTTRTNKLIVIIRITIKIYKWK